jgi:NAD(P)-dependent dehydrogenase (short-subunit alcohol dehydrogenase family)
VSYTCWVSASEALEFAGSESNCHLFCSCPIAGRQKDAEIAKIFMKVLKRFGNRRLLNKTVRPWIPVYKIYSIHEFYRKTFLISAAAINSSPDWCAFDLPQLFKDILDVHLVGDLRLANAFRPHLKASNGCLINIVSI